MHAVCQILTKIDPVRASDDMIMARGVELCDMASTTLFVDSSAIRPHPSKAYEMKEKEALKIQETTRRPTG